MKDILFYYLDNLKCKVRKVNKNEYILEDEVRMKILNEKYLMFNNKDMVKMSNFIDGIKELYKSKKRLNSWKNSGKVKRKFGRIKKRIMYDGKSKVKSKVLRKECRWFNSEKDIKELKKII